MQFNNAAHNENQVDRFLGRNEFHHDGARLADAMMWANRDGGGSLLWAFDGQSPAAYGRAAAAAVAAPWVEQGGIVLGNYGATANGGPYVTLDGAGEYLDVVDAPYQEATTNSFLIWSWFNVTSIASTQTVAAKWVAAGNLRSWWLRVSSTTGALRWSTNDTGGAGSNVDMDSALVITAGSWHFGAAYFEPSMLMRTFSSSASDNILTIDSLTSGVPANVFNGVGTPLSLGANAAGNLLGGNLGIGLVRANVPAANINSYVTRLFASTRWFYNG